MSDAITAAQMISTSLFTSQIGDIFSPSRAHNNDAAEIARLQALVQRLANYGRYVEQQHNSLLADAKRIDAQRCQQINAQLQEIDGLHREIADKRQDMDAMVRHIARQREELSTLTCRKLDYMMKADQLERRVAALEAENAKLRQAEPSD